MDERVSAAAAAVGAFGSTDFYFAIALRNSRGRARLSDADQFRFVGVVGLPHVVEQLDGVLLNHGVEHVLDFVGGRALVGYDKRVEATFVEELQPSHVELCGSRAAPLSGFKEDEADREIGFAFFFEASYEDALREA